MTLLEIGALWTEKEILQRRKTRPLPQELLQNCEAAGGISCVHMHLHTHSASTRQR